MITQLGAERLLQLLDSQANLWVGLARACPSVSDTRAHEPKAASYSRKWVSGNRNSAGDPKKWGEIQRDGNGAKRTTDLTIYFNEAYDNVLGAVEDWGELRYVCLFLSETGDDLFAFQELPEPIHPGANNQSSIALIRSGDLTIEIGNPAPAATNE